MKENLKQLLLKDLCARLPYGVKVHRLGNHKHSLYKLEVLDAVNYEIYMTSQDPYMDNSPFITKYAEIEEVKPYLFPLSSITEEQYNEIQTISGKDCMEHMEIEKEWRNNSPFTHLPLYQHRVIEFFHKYHFDYRGLIPMGLAIDATGKNIY